MPKRALRRKKSRRRVAVATDRSHGVWQARVHGRVPAVAEAAAVDRAARRGPRNHGHAERSPQDARRLTSAARLFCAGQFFSAGIPLRVLNDRLPCEYGHRSLEDIGSGLSTSGLVFAALYVLTPY